MAGNIASVNYNPSTGIDETEKDDIISHPVFTSVDGCELSIKSLQATYIEPRLCRGEDPNSFNDHFRRVWVTVVGPTQQSVCHAQSIKKAERFVASQYGMRRAARPATGGIGAEEPLADFIKKFNKKAEAAGNPQGRILSSDEYLKELETMVITKNENKPGQWWAKEYAFIDE